MIVGWLVGWLGPSRSQVVLFYRPKRHMNVVRVKGRKKKNKRKKKYALFAFTSFGHFKKLLYFVHLGRYPSSFILFLLLVFLFFSLFFLFFLLLLLFYGIVTLLPDCVSEDFFFKYG